MLRNVIKERKLQDIRLRTFEATFIRGKINKIHARYPLLGDGTYKPTLLSVSYLQVGYWLVAAGKSRVIYAGHARFPYPLSDDYKRRVPHTTRYPEDMTKC